MSSTWNSKRIIITGASSGIGKAMALQLAAEGARLTLAARREDLLAEVAETCTRLGGTATVAPTDVTDPEQCRLMVERTVAQWNGVDVLINNAGTSMWAQFEEITDLSIFRKLMDVNYLGAVYCTYYALPHLRASRGTVVAVSSLAGKTGVPTRTAYSASKFALNGFLEALRVELLGGGVTVTVVHPGFVQTEIRRHSFAGDGSFLKSSHLEGKSIMTADTCAAIILDGAARKKREVVMTAVGRIGQYVKPFLPGLIDRIARKKVGL